MDPSPLHVEPTPTSDATESPGSVSEPTRYTGEVVYLYAFDIAYEMNRRPIARLLGQPTAEFVMGSSKRTPKQLFFHRPLSVRLPALERPSSQGILRVERGIKVLPIGAISITVRIPFQTKSLRDLVAFHDLQFGAGAYLYDEVRALAEDVRRELRPYLIRPVDQLGDEEAYTVFCLNAISDAVQSSAEEWFLKHRRDVAALLTEEPDPQRLAEQEAVESTSRYLSYYSQDLVVIDWDAALLVDEPRYFDETLYVMELANLQLAELEAYDRILDDTVERSYRDISNRRAFGRQTARVQRGLREIRIDLSRLSDELSNITKFFGDWHLARLYQALSARFHLGDWHRTIDEKLKTVDELYELLRAEQNNRWMLYLEASMALLFIIDVVLLIMQLRHP
jgi:hypothetical protein